MSAKASLRQQFRARRLALQWKGLPEDPDQTGLRQA